MHLVEVRILIKLCTAELLLKKFPKLVRPGLARCRPINCGPSVWQLPCDWVGKCQVANTIKYSNVQSINGLQICDTAICCILYAYISKYSIPDAVCCLLQAFTAFHYFGLFFHSHFNFHFMCGLWGMPHYKTHTKLYVECFIELATGHLAIDYA